MIDRHPALSQTSGNRKRPSSVSSTCVNQVLSKRFCQPCLAGGQRNSNNNDNYGAYFEHTALTFFRLWYYNKNMLISNFCCSVEQQLKSRVRELVVCVKISWQWKTEVENKVYVNRQTQIKHISLEFNIAVVDIFVGNLNGDKKFDMLYCGVSISMDSPMSSHFQSHVSHIGKSFFTVGLAHLPKLNNESREIGTERERFKAVSSLLVIVFVNTMLTLFSNGTGEKDNIWFGLTDGGEMSSTTLALRNGRMPTEACFKLGQYKVEHLHINLRFVWLILKEIRVSALTRLENHCLS
ncbi:hypothetical protein T07_6792 [Trichinella nelsoni]|uniref:Uncharacterized protein n=1 Tax=Trichinella nelsoni TaxID=6336 RepID=A0A0V0RGG1_9BILA|nr:hypothetical protein T07_6792 [Trichinella nelsoni]